MLATETLERAVAYQERNPRWISPQAGVSHARPPDGCYGLAGTTDTELGGTTDTELGGTTDTGPGWDR